MSSGDPPISSHNSSGEALRRGSRRRESSGNDTRDRIPGKSVSFSHGHHIPYYDHHTPHHDQHIPYYAPNPELPPERILNPIIDVQPLYQGPPAGVYPSLPRFQTFPNPDIPSSYTETLLNGTVPFFKPDEYRPKKTPRNHMMRDPRSRSSSPKPMRRRYTGKNTDNHQRPVSLTT